MVPGLQYQAAPLRDREQSNKNASAMENKYKNPVSKRVTLNERFGVLEKGFFLHTKEPAHVVHSDVTLVVLDRHLISKKDFINNYLAKNPIVEAPAIIEEEDKENAPTKKSSEKTTVEIKKEFTAEDYVRDITKCILKSI